jgi:2-aminoadipate transaminase
VGWMIAPAALLAKAVMCKQFSDAHTSTFAQATAAAYLAQGGLSDALNQVRQVYAERARTMCDALNRELGDAIAFVRPAGGLFVWASLTGANGAIADGNAFAKRAIDHNVAFVPGAPFFARDPDARTLRLSFATADVEKIEAGVMQLGKALHSA